MTLRTLLLLSFAAMLITFSSCEDDKEDPVIPNEEEVITTIIYTLEDSITGDKAVFTFKDLDGDGGNAPIIEVDTLVANRVYKGSLQLLNETETPAEDITEEVKEEDEEHQVFYNSATNGFTVNYSDQDSNGKPLGLETILRTGAAGTDTLTITLKHEPNKSAVGAETGDINAAGGETDIAVPFNIVVQ